MLGTRLCHIHTVTRSRFSVTTTQARTWLAQLSEELDRLPSELQPKPHWSQRQTGSTPQLRPSLQTVVRRVRTAISDLERRHFFAEVLGYECVDDRSESTTDIVEQLDRRIGKGHLDKLPDEDWSVDDLFDVVEVYHDLAARPSDGYHHNYMGCGFHPTAYSRAAGRAIYIWTINEILKRSDLQHQLATTGEDAGRLVRATDEGSEELILTALQQSADLHDSEVPHAIALFRARNAGRDEKRSAIVVLAGILEGRREYVKSVLTRKDEGVLFTIANEFDLRHRKPSQLSEYSDPFLDWIFSWYLATVQLIRDLDAVNAQLT
jgi:hypothetical protein